MILGWSKNGVFGGPTPDPSDLRSSRLGPSRDPDLMKSMISDVTQTGSDQIWTKVGTQNDPFWTPFWTPLDQVLVGYDQVPSHPIPWGLRYPL